MSPAHSFTSPNDMGLEPTTSPKNYNWAQFAARTLIVEYPPAPKISPLCKSEHRLLSSLLRTVICTREAQKWNKGPRI